MTVRLTVSEYRRTSLSRLEERGWLGRQRAEREPEPWQEECEPSREALAQAAADIGLVSPLAFLPWPPKDTEDAA